MTNFEIIIPFVIANEGGSLLSITPYDNGNWTGGKKGVGLLKGSKFGISAAQYPNIDFSTFTQEQAEAIYLSDYWNKMNLESLPVAIAFLVMDAGVNSGPKAGVEWLQQAVGLTGANVDGVCGPFTQKMVNNYASGQETLCLQFGITHMMAITEFDNFKLYQHEYISRTIGNSMTAQKLLNG